MPLTNPRSPIHIMGKPFTEWREAGPAHCRGAVLAVIVDGETASDLMLQLGQYVPGIVEDGTALEFNIISFAWVGPNRHEVTVIPSVKDAWGDLL